MCSHALWAVSYTHLGVEGTPEQIAEQFELQALLNDKVKNIVGHTSLNFSPEDSASLKSDDVLMLNIAHDYMKPVSYTHLDVYKRQQQLELSMQQLREFWKLIF